MWVNTVLNILKGFFFPLSNLILFSILFFTDAIFLSEEIKAEGGCFLKVS